MNETDPAHKITDRPVDLRVDLAPDAITALRTLWDAYAPSVREFVTRAVDPDAAPGVI